MTHPTRRDILKAIPFVPAATALPAPAELPARTGPAVIPLLPRPVQMFVGTMDGITAITRIWPHGTDWCGRCPLEFCKVDRDVCLILTDADVPDSEAADYTTHHQRRVTSRG
jgi:hypothetical protein